MIINALRLFDMNDIREIEEMTYYEYDLRLTAYKLKEVDKAKKIHELAWANREVQGTKKNGEYTYTKFKDFFNMEEVEREVLGLEKEKLEDKYDKDLINALLL